MAADKAGLKEGDQIVSVNKQDVTSMKHEDLVSMIKRVSLISVLTAAWIIKSINPRLVPRVASCWE